MGTKSNKSKSKIHRDWHHIFPTSRFKIKKPIEQHQAWHKLFGDLTTVEAILKIRSKWTSDNGKIDFNRMTQEEKEYWLKVFFNSGETLEEAVNVINHMWSIPGVKIVFESHYERRRTKGLVS